jgi:predicted nucleic acid-binding protein
VILLDTNVVSAVMAPAPPAAVLEWLDGQPSDALYISAITLAEIHYGLQALPEGKRRQNLADRFERFVASGFTYRVLPFDEEAAYRYGELMARRRKLGRPVSVLDGQIAAIARANRCTVATRNVRDFEECGLELVNPFDRDG